ncbi:Zinc finger, FYVE-related [Phytophthora cactorum]|nr:Zinc finger, FYVE-related [Phytophthora cactorum]
MAATVLGGGTGALFSSASPRAMDMLETAGLNGFATPECRNIPGCARITPNTTTRKVLVSDAELRRRVEDVKITTDFNNALANVSLHGWKWKRDCSTFSVFTRSITNGSGATVADAQVLAMGTVSGGRALERLVSLLRTPNESDLNKVMQNLYKRDFIYGSLVHATPSDSASVGDGSLLTVKTCAFVRSKRFSHKKNEQMCYIEQFRPTKDGFALHEILAGKASGKHVDEVSPYRGWLLVEKAPETNAGVRVLFHAGVDPDFVDADKNTNLGFVLHHQRRVDCTKVKNNPRQVSTDVSNSHCVACTSKFDLLRRRRRCGLCTYNACSKCCYREPMIIYNRYAATIQFCARCRECMIGGEYPHLRLAARRHSSPGIETSLATPR